MMTTRSLPWLLSSVLLFHAASAVAANETQLADLTAEDYFFTPMPMVLSASRLAQSQYQTPVAVTIIDRAMIDASGALDIPDLLRLVPGFQVSHAAGHTTSATYHGLADEYARRMQVLIDNRPVYGPVLGGVRWTDIPVDIEDIERIEVVRGPNTAAYGANSFLGAINITTIHSAQAKGNKVLLASGNKDMQKYYARHGGELGELNYRLTLAHREDEGFKSYKENIDQVITRDNLGVINYISYPPGIEVSGEGVDSKRVSLLNFRGDYIAPNHDVWEFHVGYNGGPRQEGRSILDWADPQRTREVESHFQQIKWERTFSADDSISIQFHHTLMDQSERSFSDLSIGEILFVEGIAPSLAAAQAYIASIGETDEPLLLDFSTHEQRYEIELQHNLRLDQSKRMAWGMSVRHDRVNGPGWFNTTDDIINNQHRLFANMEWQALDKTIINFGTMFEHSDLAGSHISPRLAVNYQLHPNHGLRAGVSRAIRMPTVLEQKIDSRLGFIDGPTLDVSTISPNKLTPERMRSFELGYLGNWPEKHLTLDAKLFHDEIEDRIHNPKDLASPYDPVDNRVLIYTNTGAVDINGAEFALSWRPATRTMANLSYAYAKANGWAFNALNNPNDPHDTENLQDDVPTHTISLFLMHRLPGRWDVSSTFYKVRAMRWLGDGDKLPGYKRLDFRIKKGFSIGNNREGHVALSLQNVLDEYQEFRAENIFDTRGYLELGLEF